MKRKKFLALLLAALLCFPLAACNTGGGDEDIVEPPDPVSKVTSVAIQYNSAAVAGGVINVDLSAGTITLSAAVQKTDDSVNGTVTFASSVVTVATIASTGVVTLKAKGETVISASAGDKKHEVVLIVGDDYAPLPTSYTVTVVGGTASQTGAAAGEYVLVTPKIPKGSIFLGWEYSLNGNPIDAGDLWLNGNILKMPAGNLIITALTQVVQFSLTAYKATVIKVDGFAPEAEEADEPAEDGVNVYFFDAGQEITVMADEAAADEMFVGWDCGEKYNRVGELGDPELTFEMPGGNYEVWAGFSKKRSFANPTGSLLSYGGSGTNSGYINEGKGPSEQLADPDLEKMSGYRLSISGTEGGRTDYPERVRGMSFSTIRGSQTVVVVLKNHHPSASILIGFYLTSAEFDSHGAVGDCGDIELAPGAVVKRHFIVPYGFHNSNTESSCVGFQLRRSASGWTERAIVDIVFATADTWPDGDMDLIVSKDAQWANVGTYTLNGNVGAANERNGRRWLGAAVNNDIGLTMAMANRYSTAGNDFYVISRINNMPAYNSSAPTTRIYFKAFNTTKNTATFKFNFGTAADPNAGTGGSLASVSKNLGMEQATYFYIDIPRSAGDQTYFSLTLTSNPINYNYGKGYNAGLLGLNIIVQISYNNIFEMAE